MKILNKISSIFKVSKTRAVKKNNFTAQDINNAYARVRKNSFSNYGTYLTSQDIIEVNKKFMKK